MGLFALFVMSLFGVGLFVLLVIVLSVLAVFDFDSALGG